MARRSAGISGTAVLFGAAGIYLVYAGIKDVPIVAGLRSLLRGEAPEERAGVPTADIAAAAVAAAGPATTGVGSTDGSGGRGGRSSASLGLVGNAARGWPTVSLVVPALIVVGGRAARPNNPSSDHPKGLAVDVMVKPGNHGPVGVADPANLLAGMIIGAFKLTAGSHYAIWNGRLMDRDEGWAAKPYTKFGGHYDHVHLSWR